jgi:hypothetical protein
MADELDFLDTHVGRGLRFSERRHWREQREKKNAETCARL